jgi:tetratricopeptide (TPR) repeat protein
VWDKAVDYLREAGRQVGARGAIAESAQRFEQALELLRRLPPGPPTLRRAIDVRLDLSVPMSLQGRIARLMELQLEAEPLARELGDERTLGWIAQRLAAYSWFPGRYREGVAQAERGLTIAEEIGDVPLRLASQYAFAMHRLGLGDYRAAIDAFIGIVDGPDAAIAQHVPGMNVPVYSGSCSWLTFCLATMGEFERALGYSDPAHQPPDLDPVAEAMLASFRPSQFAVHGQFERALELCDHAVSVCQARNVPVWLAQSLSLRGLMRAWLGRTDEALGELERGAGLFEQFGIESHRAMFLSRWSEGLLLAGRVEQARALARQALDLAQRLGEKGNEAQAYVLLGDIAGAGAEPREALGLFRTALGACEGLGMRPAAARCHLGLGTIHRREGEAEPAQWHLDAAARMFGEMRMRFWQERAEAERRELPPQRGG